MSKRGLKIYCAVCFLLGAFSLCIMFYIFAQGLALPQFINASLWGFIMILLFRKSLAAYKKSRKTDLK
jgi:hypothetical protein